MTQCTDRSLLEMDQMIHTCILCILSCHPHNIPINIISLDIRLNLIIDQIIRLINGLIPEFLINQICPALSRKRTIHSRCNICCHHCCLNWKCSTSAKRIH